MLVRYNRLKIIIGACEAKPGGSIGATLSPYLFSANMTDFCKKFNEATQLYEVGFPLCVEIFCDVVEKNYSFLIKKPSLTYFIRKLRMDLRATQLFSFLNLYDLAMFFSNHFKISRYSASLFLLKALRHKELVSVLIKYPGLAQLSVRFLSR